MFVSGVPLVPIATNVEHIDVIARSRHNSTAAPSVPAARAQRNVGRREVAVAVESGAIGLGAATAPMTGTQAVPDRMNPLSHAKSQLPPEQTALPFAGLGHTFAQRPQCIAFAEVSTQTPLHAVIVPGHPPSGPTSTLGTSIKLGTSTELESETAFPSMSALSGGGFDASKVLPSPPSAADIPGTQRMSEVQTSFAAHAGLQAEMQLPATQMKPERHEGTHTPESVMAIGALHAVTPTTMASANPKNEAFPMNR